MTCLPIVVRELRVRARERTTHWERVVFVLWGALICGAVLGSGSLAVQIIGGRVIFWGLAQMLFFYGVSAGCLWSALGISREIRAGTLGLLFLTRLKGYEVILGKLIAALLATSYDLFALSPVLAIPIVLGVVEAGDLCRVTLALLNALFFGHAFALLIATQSPKAAPAKAIVLILPVVLLLPMLEPASVQSGGQALRLLAWVSPRCALHSATSFDPVSGTSHDPALFWPPLICSNLAAWLLLAVASWTVRHAWCDPLVRPAPSRWFKRWRRFIEGDAAGRAAWRAQCLAIHPYFWLLCRQGLLRFIPWLGVLEFVVSGIALLFLVHRTTPPAQEDLFFAVIWLHMGFKVISAWLVSGSFYRQKNDGELELLLAGTPLTIADIVRVARLRFRKTCGPQAAALLGLNGLMLAWGCFAPDSQFLGASGSAGQAHFILLMVALMALLPLDLGTISWVAIWTGVSAEKSSHGPPSLLVLPCLFWSMLALWVGAGPGGHIHFWLLFGLWFVLGVLADVWGARYARRRIFSEFRQRAAESADKSLAWQARFQRGLNVMLRR